MHPSWHLIFRLSLLGYIFVIYIQKGGKVVAKDPGPTCMGSKKWFPQEKVLRKRRSSMHFVAFHFSPTQFRRRRDIAKGTMDQRAFANGTALTWFFLLLRLDGDLIGTHFCLVTSFFTKIYYQHHQEHLYISSGLRSYTVRNHLRILSSQY